MAEKMRRFTPETPSLLAVRTTVFKKLSGPPLDFTSEGNRVTRLGTFLSLFNSDPFKSNGNNEKSRQRAGTGIHDLIGPSLF